MVNMNLQSVIWWFLCLCFVCNNIFIVECRQRPVFVNQFAVYIPSGPDVADKVAAKYGFKNLGQIGSLKNYYLLEHNHVHKRSTSHSEVHHNALRDEKEVHWFEQQHEKIRKKRDLTFPSYFDYGEGPKIALSDVSHHDQHYRAFGIPSSFPDPLYKEQWYLNGGAKDGFDMNVVQAWQRGYTGKGVVISILDDGIQTNHPDLALNYDHLASTDINDNDDDPMPRDNGDNKHGTRCAGEVAAVAYNDYCGIGVAYNASIGGVRMLDGTVNDAVEARALGLNPEHVDIYSASWGPEDDGKTVDGPGPLARRAFIYGVTTGRKGRGSIFIWASGNGGRHTDSCNCDGYTNSIFTLSISSATQGGYKPWYLEECSSTLATTYSSGTPGHDKSIATVDMDAKLRPDRICTVEHTGTSASAPLAAGICALALEANPELTWRDMQYLVVLTSRSAPLEKESGWIVNGVKRKVSHKFGYGLMDATAMVSLAEKWTSAPPQHICKSQEITEEKEMQPVFGATLTVHMDVDGCHGTYNEVRFLEHVQCRITLRFFPRGNLRIALTSPMGTTSTLLFERPRDVISSNFDDWPFLSVHFWGERADGRWTLQILNAGNRHVNQPGILKKWQLVFYGTASDPIRLRAGAGPGRGGNPAGASVAYPTAPSAPASQVSSVIYGGTPTASFTGNFHNYQNVYSVSGSEKDEVVASQGKENSLEIGAIEGSVMDGKHVLYDCDPQCDSQGCYGKGPAQCVSCKYYKLDGTCVSKCPPRSFPKGQFCWPCHESCETCAGAGQDSCLVCAPAHLRVTDLSVCLQQCPEGYLEDTEKGVCIPCESNCGSCTDKPDHCTSCDHHLVLYNNKCYAACPMYTYETGDYNCAPCHSTCETCNGSSETQCVTCRPGLFAHSGTCLTSCPEGFYADKKRRECLECHHGCAACNGPTCLSCTTGWILDNRRGRCLPPGSNQCDSAEYHDGGGGCRPCHSTCESCWGPTEDSCLACPSPLFLHQGQCLSTCPEKGVFPERGTCTTCPHTCVSCSSLHNCTQCVEGLHLQSGECRSTCADGYYSDRGVCAKCYLSCMTCSGPRRDQCVACPEGWQLAAGECHPECPEGYYKGEFGCQKCHHYCRTCKGEGPSNCSSCPPYLVLEKGLCIECFAWQFYDNRRKSCRSCHPSCRTCSGPGPVSCKSCALPLRFDRIDNQCVPCCTPGMNPPDCCHCDEGTGECLNYSSGGKRRTAAGADSGEAGAIVGEQENPTLRAEPFATVTALAICGCATVVLLFGLIFTLLQVNSNCNSCWKQGYEKLPTRSRTEMTEKISLAEDDETLSDQDDDEEQLFTKT